MPGKHACVRKGVHPACMCARECTLPAWLLGTVWVLKHKTCRSPCIQVLDVISPMCDVCVQVVEQPEYARCVKSVEYTPEKR